MHHSNGYIDIAQRTESKRLNWVDRFGDGAINAVHKTHDVIRFVHDVWIAFWHMLRGRAKVRKIDLWIEIDNAGLRAVPIVCLISFMVGVIIAFVGHMQLNLFGAEIYVAALVAISMVRIMGAIMTGIIMAGRTGAAYAAEIGSMSVNQEIDALVTMGVSSNEFLVLPRLVALSITMPILTIIADICAIVGGMCVAAAMMDVSMAEYWKTTLDWVSFNNFAIGVLHGWVFGIIIAITGCYCGLRTVRTADGIGRATTRAVVNGIVGCIVATAILTIIFNWLDV